MYFENVFTLELENYSFIIKIMKKRKPGQLRKLDLTNYIKNRIVFYTKQPTAIGNNFHKNVEF